MAIKYKWLAEELEQLIQKQTRSGVSKLPTEAELGRRYHVSRQTVRMALSLLEQNGLITRRQGSGAYLTGRSADPSKNRVGILLSSDQEYLYPAVLNDIQGTLQEAGFLGQVMVTENQVGLERQILLQLLKDPPRGLIAEGCKSALPNPNLELYRQLIRRGCSVVFLYSPYPDLPGSFYIKDDNFSGGALLTRHLAAQGHQSIGGIFKFDDIQGPERYQGMAEALRQLSLPFSDRQIAWYGSRELELLTQKREVSFLRTILRESLASCTAVICYNDFIAYHLVRELMTAGYELPDDMAVAAFDNTYLSNSDRLTVTTLSHLPHEMGRRAADALLRLLRGQPFSSCEVPWHLNQKQSTRSGL